MKIIQTRYLGKHQILFSWLHLTTNLPTKSKTGKITQLKAGGGKCSITFRWKAGTGGKRKRVSLQVKGIIHIVHGLGRVSQQYKSANVSFITKFKQQFVKYFAPDT